MLSLLKGAQKFAPAASYLLPRSNLSRSYAYSVLTATERAIREIQQQKIKTPNISQETLDKLIAYQSLAKKITELQVQQNQLIIDKPTPGVMTMTQVNDSKCLFELFLEQNPEIKPYLDASFQTRYYQQHPVYTKSIHPNNEHYYEENKSMLAISSCMAKALYKEMPGRHNDPIFTDYALKLKQKFNPTEFTESLMLLDNWLIEESSFTSTTRIRLGQEIKPTFPKYFDPDKTFIVELEADQKDIKPEDQLPCRNAQLKLFDLMEKDGLFDDFPLIEVKKFRQEISKQDETLINPKKLKPSHTLFYDMKKKGSSIDTSFEVPV